MADKDMEKKADALLDEEEQGETNEEETTEEKPMDDPIEQLRKLCKGKMKLMVPFRAHSQDVKEIAFDFCALTGAEMMDALDEVPVNNIFAITNAQAMALFAAAAEKCAPFVEDGGKLTRLFDAKDIKNRLSSADFTAAMRMAKLFYNASGQAGNNNISKD